MIASIGWNDDKPRTPAAQRLRRILAKLPTAELVKILRKIERVKAKAKKPARKSGQA